MCGDAINGRLSEARLTGHRDTADGDGAGLWDLIEFLCGLATGHWHWPQLGPADGWAEIRRDNGGEERAELEHIEPQRYPVSSTRTQQLQDEGRKKTEGPITMPSTQAPRQTGDSGYLSPASHQCNEMILISTILQPSGQTLSELI